MKKLKTVFVSMGVTLAMLSACNSAPQQTLTVSGLDAAKFDTIINKVICLLKIQFLLGIFFYHFLIQSYLFFFQ